VDHSLDAHYIQVSIQHQRWSVGGSKTRDDVWAATRYFGHLDRESPIVENRGERAGAAALTRRAGSEGGISGIDLYQSAGERDRIASRYDHGLPSFRGLA
jgi:hypothetical protein